MSMQECCTPPAEIAGADYSETAVLFKAIADASRLSILAWLARVNDEVCVCHFTDALPLNQPTVSHHLKILRDAGLITGERRGTWVYYKLAPDARLRLSGVIDSVFPQKVLA